MRVPDVNTYTESIVDKYSAESPNQKIVRVGTRGSRLALVQAGLVVKELKRSYPNVDFQIVAIDTRGDREKDRALMEFGGKAVFVEEFEEAISDGRIDMAVHSAKDMPTEIMEGLSITGTLKRACPQDVFIYRSDREFARDDGFVVGTSSLRRQHQIKQMYPFADCHSLRGNINTRIDKLKNGEYDAIILAAAGIERLGLVNLNSNLTFRYLSIEEMMPAACQGIIAIETKNKGMAAGMVRSINDTETYTRFMCEREVLRNLNAGCHEPIGVYSEIHGKALELSVIRVDSPSDEIRRLAVSGPLSECMGAMGTGSVAPTRW